MNEKLIKLFEQLNQMDIELNKYTEDLPIVWINHVGSLQAKIYQLQEKLRMGGYISASEKNASH